MSNDFKLGNVLRLQAHAMVYYVDQKKKRNIASCPIIWSQRSIGYWIFLSLI